MLQVIILGSGSSGNCALVCSGQARLLIDAGLSAGQIVSRLHSVGVGMDTLSGILITHEHGDHCRGLPVLTRKFPLPILCNALTREVLRDSLPDAPHWKIVPNGGSFEFEGMGIETFSVPHDAADPMGLVLRHGHSALGILSDAGHSTPIIRQRLRDMDTLFIEANYDNALLTSDTRRPWSTKQRISGRHGHLSNEQTAELVAELATVRLERVLLGHLSKDCNTPDLACASVLAELRKKGRTDVQVACAHPTVPSPWHRIRTRLPAPPVVAETPVTTWQQLELL